MRLRPNTRKARFGPETRFDLPPAPARSFRAVEPTVFERLKIRLLNHRLEETWGRGVIAPVRRAANDAAALAWVTPYPALVFPLLFEELADTAVRRELKQREVRLRSRELMLAV